MAHPYKVKLSKKIGEEEICEIEFTEPDPVSMQRRVIFCSEMLFARMVEHNKRVIAVNQEIEQQLAAAASAQEQLKAAKAAQEGTNGGDPDGHAELRADP